MSRTPPLIGHNAMPTSIEAALGVKGRLRVRSYAGNVKHAHVVLRKVDEEVYNDELGHKRTRAVFSLFAHKLINVKPGKELFMYLHPVGSDLQEHVVALEADMPNADEIDVELGDYAKSEETIVQKEQVLPPKLRKLWARKSSFPVKPEYNKPARTSVGVQVEPSTSCAQVQAQPALASVEIQVRSPTSSVQIQAQSTSSSVEVQAIPSVSSFNMQAQPSSLSVEIQTSAYMTSTGSQTRSASQVDAAAQTLDGFTSSSHVDMVMQTAGSLSRAPSRRASSPMAVSNIRMQDTGGSVLTATSTSDFGTDSCSHQRSLSPMELESAPTSPEYSPELLAIDLPSDESKLSLARSREPEDDPQLASAVTLVESPLFGTLIIFSHLSLLTNRKEDPPLHRSTSPIAKTAHSPTFIRSQNNAPALFEPKKADASTPISASIPSAAVPLPSTSKLTVDVAHTVPRYYNHTRPGPSSATYTLSSTPQVPAPLGATLIRAPPTAPAIFVRPTAGAAPVSDGDGTRPMSRFVDIRHAPKFVPATRLSQAPSPQSPAAISSSSGSQVLSQSDLQSVPTSVPSTTRSPPLVPSAMKGRKRSWPSSQAPDTIDVGMPSCKRWKPLVKPEPLSPVLSSTREAGPVADALDSAPNCPPPLSPREFSKKLFEAWTKYESRDKGPSNGLIAANADDPLHTPMTTDPAELRKQTRGPPFIDLTLPSKPPLGMAPRSGPRAKAKAKNQSQLDMNLVSLRTAQIKMSGSGREVGVRSIVFSATGALFAVVCRDNTVRIWDDATCTEIAKLAHSASVVSVVWLEGDKSVASMGTNGVVSKWTMLGENRWEWAKLVDSGDGDPSCLAYHDGKLAVANPRKGIKIWMLEDNDFWRALDRNVPRKDVVTIKFINDGHDLLCGSSDGTVFRCTVPKCRVQPVTTFKTKAFHVDADSSNRFALVAQACGRAHLIELAPTSADERDVGRIVQDFSLRDAEGRYGARATHAFGALFAGDGNSVVFGAIGGRVLVWDRKRGKIQHEMDHGKDVLVQAVASFDGKKGERFLVSSTRQGKLTWWELPEP
ncbi:hypothetical protein M0805_006415 [Coniferiporia weirii]|nr:hypothetical protein M0805_006415 [Coniferiporia weirii]